MKIQTFLIVAAISLSSISHAQTWNDNFISKKEIDVYDPFEGWNRGVHKFNKGVDTNVLRPTTEFYDTYTHPVIKQGIHNGIDYLKTPFDAAFYALQGDGDRFGNSMGRFLINTFGLGVFDIASDLSVYPEHTTLGETLGKWNIPAGPYLELPILGGSSIRGNVGKIGELEYSPFNRFDSPYNESLNVLNIIDSRRQGLAVDKVLDNFTVDDYVLYRNAVMQKETYRLNQLKEKE